MKIYSVEQLSKTYGDKPLFQDIQFHIQTGERIGLIGVNGTGKSSLLKILAQIDDADQLELTHPKDFTIGYLAQEPKFDESLTIVEQVFQTDTPIIQTVKRYEKALIQLTNDSANEIYQNELMDAQKRMDDLDGWDTSTKIKTILSKLGINDLSRTIKELSGGQKKRVALAQVLIDTPDLLLLDEPTNHLDYETIKWLEQYLKQFPNALMVVTHDRYFLDQISTKIFELDGGNLYTYTGNYQSFIEAKSIREEEETQALDKRRNLYRRELAWMRQGAKARSTKQKARIQRFEDIEASVQTNQTKEKIDISLQGSRLGKQVFEFIQANKQFNHTVILKDFDLLIKPGDRFGIVGKNGSGKSSLLNILTGRISLDSGELIIGQTVNIAYYTQGNDDVDDDMRMIQYIREGGEVVVTASGETISASQMLENFLFPPHTHGTPVRKLSGGERRRLYLLKLLMAKPNVLILDEPTNDLDTATLTVLENYIEDFPGVVISVSHDRYFLDKTAEQLLIFEGNGKIDRYYGAYSDYLERESQIAKESQLETTKQPITQSKVKTTDKKRMSYKEKREWETIESDITELEEAIEQLNEDLNTIGSDFEKAQTIMDEIKKKNDQLDHLLERWAYLSELNE